VITHLLSPVQQILAPNLTGPIRLEGELELTLAAQVRETWELTKKRAHQFKDA
jgi:hypothetical protein